MNAILLAAGKGSRISDEIGPIPKSILDIDGKPIIRRTVELLLRKGINVVVCTGYRHTLIEQVLDELPVTYINNPFFDVTNNIASLWFAQDYLHEDCIVLSADVVFKEDLLEKVISGKGNLIMATDSSRIDDGDYFFHMHKDGTIKKYGPDIQQNERDYEYVGIGKISAETIGDFRKTLNQMIDEGNTQCYFENVFFKYIGHPSIKLTIIDVAGCIWREIDRMDDYEKAKKEFNSEVDQ